MTENSDTPIRWIRPRRGWQRLDFAELGRYRDLFFFLSIRGIKARYAQSILGVGWAVIQPLFSTVVFTVVFGSLSKVKSDGAPYFIFSLVAMVPWNFFSGVMTEASNSLIANSAMINKVYFPRIILPLSATFSKGFDFLVGMFMLVIFLIIFQMPVSWSILLLPVLLLILLLTSLGIGMTLSAMAVQYRDVKHSLVFLTQLLMYVAPVVYATSSVPERFRNWYAINPMVGVIEGFRSILLSTQEFPWLWVGEAFLVSTCLFVFGVIYFSKMEKVFSDLV